MASDYVSPKTAQSFLFSFSDPAAEIILENSFLKI